MNSAIHDAPAAEPLPRFRRRFSLTPFPFLAKTVPFPLVLFRIVLLVVSLLTARAELAPGLAVQFEQERRNDRTVLPYPALHVNSNDSAALFLQPGPFTAEFTGFISIDLRAQHTFTAELAGSIELQINGKDVLKNASASETTFTSKPIRLSKGTNAFVLRFSAPTNGPAILRLFWSSRNSAVPIPIPASALSHTADPELMRSVSIHHGAFLFEQFQCARCHAPSQPYSSAWDAPDFHGIGSRLRADWMEGKILNPSADRPSRMPSLLHENTSKQNAGAIAAYLATLTTAQESITPFSTAQETGATLVNELHCRSCHTLPGESASADRLGLDHVGEKFLPGALLAYLRDPHAHYPGNPMPNFKLTRAEAESIAAFLLRGSSAQSSKVAGAAAAGRELIQKSGCLNCHALDLPNQFSAPSLSKIFSTALHGCLSTNSASAPRFVFSDTERADLRAFVSEGTSAPQISAGEFAIHATTALRCIQCHADAGLPAPLSFGEKLKPEWSAAFIAGKISEKPRPWLKGRMPAFPDHATNIAAGLANLHGFPAHSSPAPAPNPDLIQTGEKLISATGGFSCVACHAVGSSSGQLIVESPGINLAYSGDRLLPGYFHRWLMNPLAIDPGTKMPAYFDAEGRSQLHEFFEGDAAKQIDAMWHYIHSLRSTQ